MRTNFGLNSKQSYKTQLKIVFPTAHIHSTHHKKAFWMTRKAVKKHRKKHNVFKRYSVINNPKYIEAAI